MSARRLDDGLAAQVGLARRESPHRAAQHVGLAFALLEMPWIAAAFARGEISEFRATIVARETACLTREDRGEVDRQLGSRPGGLAGLGDQAITGEARRIAYALDPEAFTRRAAKAAKDRRVTLRPAPDTMAHLGALLPVREGVAVYAALTQHADALRAEGDARSRGQIMADTLVERVTGLAAAPNVPVEVNIVMSEEALLGDATAPGRDTPAHVDGYGPVPARVAREWLSDPETKAWIRRVFARPGDHALVAMDSKRRVFAGTAATIHHDPRPALPHAVVRRADPARRPPDEARRRWSDQHRELTRAVRGLQPRQGCCRLAGARLGGRSGADDHSDRASLPKSGAAKSWCSRGPCSLRHAWTSSTETCCWLRDPVVGRAQHEPGGPTGVTWRRMCPRCASAPISTSTSRSITLRRPVAARPRTSGSTCCGTATPSSSPTGHGT